MHNLVRGGGERESARAKEKEKNNSNDKSSKVLIASDILQRKGKFSVN